MRAVLSVEPVKMGSLVGDYTISYTSPEVTLWQLLAYSSAKTRSGILGVNVEKNGRRDAENDSLTGWH